MLGGSPVFGAGALDGAQSQAVVRSSGNFAVPAARQRRAGGSPPPVLWGGSVSLL